MLQRLCFSISLLTLSAGLSAQALPIQEGHDVIIASEWSVGLAFLSPTGTYDSGPTLGAASAVSYDPTTDAIFMMSDNVWATGPFLYSYNPHTHQQAYIGDLNLGADLSLIANHPVTGELFYIDGYGTNLYSLDKQTAAPTLIGSSGASLRVHRGAAFHPQTHELFATNVHILVPGTNLVTIDSATGATTVVSTLDRSVSKLAFDAQGTLFGLSGSVAAGGFKLVTINQTTGHTTVVCTYPSGLKLNGFSIMPATAPTLALGSATPIGGQPFSVAVTGAKADAHTWLAWSLTGTGSTAVPQLGVTLGLASPVGSGAPRISRLDGRFQHTGTLPALAGVQVWVQAVQMDLVSNVAAFTIQ